MRQTIRKRDIVYVCARERERESDCDIERERDRETMKIPDFDSRKTLRQRN